MGEKGKNLVIKVILDRGVGGNGLTKIYRILTGLETLAAPLDSAGDSLTKLSVNTLCFYKKLLRKTLTIDTK